MAMPKKGSRNLTVDGVRYRWQIRRRPSHGQAMAESNLTVAVEAADAPGATLLVDVGEPRPDATDGPPVAVTPGDVARWVRAARAAGWAPERPGPTFPLVAPPPPPAPDSVGDFEAGDVGPQVPVRLGRQ